MNKKSSLDILQNVSFCVPQKSQGLKQNKDYLT